MQRNDLQMQRIRTHLVQVLDILDLALEELLELELLLAEILPNALTDQSGLTDTFSFHFGSYRFSIQLDSTGFLRSQLTLSRLQALYASV